MLYNFSEENIKKVDSNLLEYKNYNCIMGPFIVNALEGGVRNEYGNFVIELNSEFVTNTEIKILIFNLDEGYFEIIEPTSIDLDNKDINFEYITGDYIFCLLSP